MRTVFKKMRTVFKKMRTLAWVRILVPGLKDNNGLFYKTFFNTSDNIGLIIVKLTFATRAAHPGLVT